MDKKGQIIAVDFLFALVLLALALGYTFRIAEANDYALKEEEFFADLQRIGTASADLLVSSPDFACEITMGGTPQYFPNCINEAKLATATKDKLGIPSQYNFRIEMGALTLGDPAPPPAPAGPENVYSEKRTVFSGAGNPASIQAIKSLAQKELTLEVWKP